MMNIKMRNIWALPQDLQRKILHWELLLVQKEREFRRNAAATRIQAVVRQWLVNHDRQMQISGWGGLEDLVHGDLSNDQVAALHDWHPFSWDWFVKERQAWAEHEGYAMDWQDENQDPLDVTLHSFDFNINFGPEYSSDNSGDGPFGAIMLIIILVLDKLNSQRGRIGQWRAKDRALKQLSEEYPFTFVVTCTIIRHKIGRDYYLKAAQQLGKRYRSNNAGDGPPSAKVVEEPPIPDVGDIVVEEDDMEILLFRFEILTEMIDLQIWTYGMRLHEHEYQGEPFDHHEHLGTTEIFARISRFNNALHNHFRTGGGDCWVDRESWMSTLNDLETIERADMFHDVHCQEHLQSLVTDFILFSVMDDHHFEPRSTDTCFQIPLF